ncbi:MAG: precorrin-2 C(20)-methyltransferase [Treponema sp.]|nr:precorrin-2 C(20)-methyltransferase [Treponema sp.]
MTQGTFYAVSCGAGNPQMITQEALNILKECHYIFYPKSPKNTIAIDSLSTLDLSEKTLISCLFTMTSEKGESLMEYEKIAGQIIPCLKEGKSAAMICLGDVSLYSSASRMALIIQKAGFKIRFIAGVTSFSAAAAAASLPLCERDEMLSVIPADAFYNEGKLEAQLKNEGSKVLMKMGRHLKEICLLLKNLNLISSATLIQRAGMEGEKIFRQEEILSMREEDHAFDYLSLIIIKKQA